MKAEVAELVMVQIQEVKTKQKERRDRSFCASLACEIN